MGGSEWLMALGGLLAVIIVADGRWRIVKRVRRRPRAEAPAQRALASPASNAPSATTALASAHPASSASQEPTSLPSTVAPGSLVGASLHISGDLVSQEPLVIHGTINGSVTARQHGVMVAASGTVTDAIDARRVVVAGRVTGSLHAAEAAVLLATAHVDGTIHAGRLSCAAGARLQGAIHTPSQRSCRREKARG